MHAYIGRDSSLVCSQSSLKSSSSTLSTIQFCHVHAPPGSTAITAVQSPHIDTPAEVPSGNHLELTKFHQSDSSIDRETNSISEDFNNATADSKSYVVVLSRLASWRSSETAGAGTMSLYMMSCGTLAGAGCCKTPGCERPVRDTGSGYCVGCRNKEAMDGNRVPAIRYPSDDDDDAASVDDGGEVSGAKRKSAGASARVERHSLHRDGCNGDNDDDGNASIDDGEIPRGKLDNNISGEASAEQEVKVSSLNNDHDDDDDEDADLECSNSSNSTHSHGVNQPNAHLRMNGSRPDNIDTDSNDYNIESAYNSSSSTIAVEVTHDPHSMNGSKPHEASSSSNSTSFSPCRGPYCSNAGLIERRGLCEACYKTLYAVNCSLCHGTSPDDLD